MSALQLWLQNHNRKLTQDAIDEALMEYITHVEKQRDALVEAATMAVEMIEYEKHERRHVRWKLQDAIASVKEKS